MKLWPVALLTGALCSSLSLAEVRQSAADGPLQEMAVTGVLTVALQPTDSGTLAVVTYRISGDASHGLDQFVTIVDRVIGQQFGSLATFVANPVP